MPGLLGKKIGMTRIIQDDGRVISLTVVQCQPNKVVQVKTTDKDGYPALVLGFEPLKKPTKNRKYRHFKEFRNADGDDSLKIGDDITVGIFSEGDRARMTSTSKGKGFQGVIKRHNFSRGPETHGSHHHREPGSIGACSKPGKVWKGKKLPGQMGNAQVTLKNIEIVYVDTEKNLLGIKGAVPGAKGALVILRKNS